MVWLVEGLADGRSGWWWVWLVMVLAGGGCGW